MSTNFVKIVTADIAAKAMGGFSLPEAGSNARSLAAGDKMDWFFKGETRKERAKIRREAAHCVEAVDAAVQKSLFWTATHSWGGRMLTLDDGADDPIVVPDWGMDEDDVWLGYVPGQVLEAEYTSASSGSTLRYERKGYNRARGVAWGELSFTPPATDIHYRGAYFAAWQRAEGRLLHEAGSRLVYTTG